MFLWLLTVNPTKGKPKINKFMLEFMQKYNSKMILDISTRKVTRKQGNIYILTTKEKDKSEFTFVSMEIST